MNPSDLKCFKNCSSASPSYSDVGDIVILVTLSYGLFKCCLQKSDLGDMLFLGA